jgi:hypothetical protein
MRDCGADERIRGGHLLYILDLDRRLVNETGEAVR